jgi:ribulose-5-phosphate 4-epimerase/fuculose-1-phosphate aldolase
MRKIHVIGGGTVAHIRPHLALSAPAYGATVRHLFDAITVSEGDDYLVHLYTTKMAGNRHQVWTQRLGIDDDEPLNLETNADIARLLDFIVAQPEPSIVFLPAALCDFEVQHLHEFREGINAGAYMGAPGKDQPRLSSQSKYSVSLVPAGKVISQVRKTRKDIFLVGFKTTTGAEKQQQFDAGLELLKKASCNLVLANDLVTKLNMVITPEQAPYYVSTDRRHTLRQLVGMVLERSKGHFTRSTVVPGGNPVTWRSDTVPTALRAVVDHCVKRGAYKPFLGKTVGHFAFKFDDHSFVTSKRGVDFNQLEEVGMVMVESTDADHVIALGAKPSVGGMSQRIIFGNHPGLDCIVHFHCPMRKDARQTPTMAKLNIPPQRIEVRSQAPYECGSHECGQNTSDGLKTILLDSKDMPIMKAVMLDNHGPNIVFSSRLDPRKVIDFIERHWDLDHATSEVP